MQHINWDDLRYVLVVARTGSLTAAAGMLKVNRTTVLRRINALEEQLDYPLFERSRSGYVITPDAERLLSHAREMEKTILELEHRVSGEKPEIEGDLRVTTTDSILPVLVNQLASFHRKHPLICVELAVTNHRLNLPRREADVAVRPTVSPPDNLWNRRIGELAFAIYGTAQHLKKHAGRPFVDHPWLGLDEPLAASLPGRWMQSEIPVENIRLRADSFVVLRMVAERGLGLALMPCHIGDASRKLKRLGSPLHELNVGLWVLTHVDMARSARVRAFIDHLETSMQHQHNALHGIST